jgi:hypothetical protein
MSDTSPSYAAFEGARLLAIGELPQVALRAKEALDRGSSAPVLVFDNSTSQQVEVDFRGQPGEVLERLAPPPRRPGRPKLGVVAREVTLLPRHWEWLAAQPGGASVALRKLVEAARRDSEGPDRRRAARDAAYRFASVIAGDRPGFEDMSRALFAGDAASFAARIAEWPTDIAEHLRGLASEAFEAQP